MAKAHGQSHHDRRGGCLWDPSLHFLHIVKPCRRRHGRSPLGIFGHRLAGECGGRDRHGGYSDTGTMAMLGRVERRRSSAVEKGHRRCKWKDTQFARARGCCGALTRGRGTKSPPAGSCRVAAIVTSYVVLVSTVAAVYTSRAP